MKGKFARRYFRSNPLFLLAVPLLFGVAGFLLSCGTNPYPREETSGHTYYTSYADPPKHLDPAVSYYSYEATIVDHIYETLYQYHYLKRPYELTPLLAETMPKVIYVKYPDGDRVRYRIRIRDDVLYHEDPCFTVSKEWGGRTRAVRAADFVTAFKRLADPRVPCPIRPILSGVIVGMKGFTEANKDRARTDYDLPLEGVQAPDSRTLEIELLRPYPQIRYWLAMHFTSPIPQEALEYYNGEEGRGTLDRHPVGTGPFRMTEWVRRQRIVLEKNSRYHEECYPSEGEPGDEEAGLLRDAGKRLPLLDRIVLSYEVESIPRWRKFLQGWYDATGLARETFDQVVTKRGELAAPMAVRGVRLHKAVEPAIYYFAFNMNDSVVGGSSRSARKLRQALSAVFDTERFLRIFLNGRGIPAQEIVPPGIFGHQGDTNPFHGRNLALAKRLIREAGYPDGIDPATGRPLVLTFDNAMNNASSRPQLQFIKEQFEALGIRLELRTTDLNTFRSKVRAGNYQIILSGWILDYPDPENVLFLLEGSQSTIPFGGENRANYRNAEYDRLYAKIAEMENGEERFRLIGRMTNLVRRDVPWIPIFFNESYALTHSWCRNFKMAPILNNALKYRDVDPEKRRAYQEKYASPRRAPLFFLLVLLLALPIAGYLSVKRREG
ncbi:MAG: peptide ABC transporter substrate-binding protein [Candidatus Hydrogenedentota bacterium]|nr:MAG: peptide ABC transporter substrate-binding protein [Candidatus Hydrogenedentota bacterium]